MLWLFKINFCGFHRFLIHGNSSYVVLYTQCLRYNICSAWFLDIRISTCALPDIYALTPGVMRIYQAKQSCLYYNLYIYNEYIYIYIYILYIYDLKIMILKRE